MRSIAINQRTTILAKVQSSQAAKAFVLSLWLVMTLIPLAYLVKDSHNIPFSEDWLLVSPLTGNEPDLVKWLWTQNNEHRIPFPRLILLALLKLTYGDFRAGMVFNIIILSALALAMIYVARQVRGGRTTFADAFFPIALLHLGNWENLFWGWQLTQVVPMVLSCLILLVLAGSQIPVTPAAALTGGISLMLLPLSGANGLVFVPCLSLWLGYCGLVHWRTATTAGGRRWMGGFLIASTLIAWALTALYFTGYHQPPHQAPNPTIIAALRASIQFLALGFGPVARSSWTLSMIAVLAVLLPSALIIGLAVLKAKGLERYRALGILIFFGNMMMFALAMGWGRAEVLKLPVWGGVWPTRYVLLSVPALCAVFFIWEIYGSPKLRSPVQNALFLGMFLLIPFNTVHGFWWRDWYLGGVKPLEQDLLAGLPHSAVVERNREFMFRWMDPNFDKLRMLHEAGIGPFARMGKDPTSEMAVVQAEPFSQPLMDVLNNPLVSQEIRYSMPEAREVYFLWGINGWQALPEDLRPARTELKDKVMYTSMIQEGNTFVARVQVPMGTAIDYCFLITQAQTSFDITWPICEGNFRQIALGNSVKAVKTALSFALKRQEIRYPMPGADEVFLVWGLNSWALAPEELRPAGTEVKDNIMYSPMLKEGDTFVAKVQAPAETTINYGFQITKGRELFNVNYPVWDWNNGQDYQMIVSEDGVTEVETTLSLAKDLPAPVTHELRYSLPGAKKVYLVWGVNGWQVVPEGSRPVGTEVKNDLMYTPMIQEDDTFSVRVQAPAGTTINYVFQITESQGVFDIVYPLWEESGEHGHQVVAAQDGITEIQGTVSLPKDLADVIDHRVLFLSGFVTLLGAWLVSFFLIGLVNR